MSFPSLKSFHFPGPFLTPMKAEWEVDTAWQVILCVSLTGPQGAQVFGMGPRTREGPAAAGATWCADPCEVAVPDRDAVWSLCRPWGASQSWPSGPGGTALPPSADHCSLCEAQLSACSWASGETERLTVGHHVTMRPERPTMNWVSLDASSHAGRWAQLHSLCHQREVAHAWSGLSRQALGAQKVTHGPHSGCSASSPSQHLWHHRDYFQQMATRSNYPKKKKRKKGNHTEPPKSVFKKCFENLLYRFFKQCIWWLLHALTFV